MIRKLVKEKTITEHKWEILKDVNEILHEDLIKLFI